MTDASSSSVGAVGADGAASSQQGREGDTHDSQQKKHKHHSQTFLGRLRPEELAVAGSKRARRSSVLLDESTFSTNIHGTRRPYHKKVSEPTSEAAVQPKDEQQQPQPAPAEKSKKGRGRKKTTDKSSSKAKKESIRERLPEDLRKCYDVVRALMKCPEAAAFVEPVDPVALRLPHYAEVVRHPMDLGTVRRKIESGAYSSPDQCHADALLVFDNALAFNPLGHPIHACAAALKDVYTDIFSLSSSSSSGEEEKEGFSSQSGAVEAATAAEIAAYVKSCHSVRAAEGRRRVYELELKERVSGDDPVDDATRSELASKLEDASGKAAADVARVLAMHVKVSKPTAFDKPQNNSDCAEIDYDQLDQLTLQAIKQSLESS